ncbi:DUF6518 family protein [Streptomyces sp. bgisy091]|uniref:DUF6518 family protein n=1 Tax=Streptomyces sp. bgisy091 TaxID=3413778 RepID=UPI003D734F95
MFISRSFALTSVAALAAGAILGIGAPLLGATESVVGNAIHVTLSGGWLWAAFGFCVGFVRTSKVESAVLASASLAVAVVAYYVAKMWQEGSFESSIYSRAIFWSVAAAAFGPILGVAGNLARNRGLRGLAFRVFIPVVAIVETSQRIRVEAPFMGATAGATWGCIRLAAVAAVIALVGHAVIRWRPRLRAKRRGLDA